MFINNSMFFSNKMIKAGCLYFPSQTPFKTGLLNKIGESSNIIQKAINEFGSNIAISFNGGKDSTVLLDLINRYKQQHNIDFPLKVINFANKSEFPEIQNFMNFSESHWKISIEHTNASSIREGFISSFQKNNLNAVFLGVRKNDPEGKNLTHFEKMTKGWPNATRVFPILNWEYSDIWEYLDTLKIPYCSLYDQGYTSIGTPNDSQPNPSLFDYATKLYHPARELNDGKNERNGRLSK